MYFLPNYQLLKKLSKGVSKVVLFVLVANWLVTNFKLQQMTASYGKSGSFSAQILDMLELPASSCTFETLKCLEWLRLFYVI